MLDKELFFIAFPKSQAHMAWLISDPLLKLQCKISDPLAEAKENPVFLKA